MPNPITFSHLRQSNPELYESLDQIDQAAERSGGLERTEGVFTDADLAAADRMAPGTAALVTSSVGNASARALSDALSDVQTAGNSNGGPPAHGRRVDGNGGPPRASRPLRASPGEIADAQRAIDEAIRRASYSASHGSSADARGVLARCHRALAGKPGYTAQLARRLAAAQDDYDNSYDNDARAIITDWVAHDPFRGVDPARDMQIAKMMAKAASDHGSSQAAVDVIATYHRAWEGRPEYTADKARALAAAQDDYDNSYDNDARAIITGWAARDPYRGQDVVRDLQTAKVMARAANEHGSSQAAVNIMRSYHDAWLGRPEYTSDMARAMASVQDDFDNSYDNDARALITSWVASDPYRGRDPERDVRMAITMAAAANDHGSSAAAREVIYTYHNALLNHPGYTFDHAVRLSEAMDNYDDSYDRDARKILNDYNARRPGF